MRKFRYVWICVILAIVMALGSIGTTYSATVSELNQKKSDVQNKINQANKEIEKLSAEMTEVEKQVSQLNAQIVIYTEEINNLEQEIKDNETKLTQLQSDYQKRSEILANRIVAQYEAGDITYLDVLFSSESLTDFISNYYLLGEIADMDVSLITEIENTKNEIEQTKKQLEADKASVVEQKNNLEARKQEKGKYRAQLQQEKASAKAQVDKMDEEVKAVQAEIDKAVQAASGYVGSFSGTLNWPLSSSSYCYNLITSGFGMRNQPTAGASTNHRALDIGVSYQPVYAAADGYVVIASSYGGYGNFIMIKHTNNLYTCYGHLSSYKVSAGQTVKRGQQIAVSGNTGVSTGPHLHFEVRTSSDYSARVNPLDYISNDIYSKLIFRNY